MAEKCKSLVPRGNADQAPMFLLVGWNDPEIAQPTPEIQKIRAAWLARIGACSVAFWEVAR